MSSDPALDALLGAKTIAVVGLDTRTFRPAYEVAAYLQSQGYRIIPVPVQQPADEVLGERAYASLRDIPEHVDLVDVFVRPGHTGRFVDDAIAIGAGAVWLQLGIRNEAAIERALGAGLVATQDRCTKVEHQRAQALGLR
ncbi:MAG: CoA-binding protein [Chloroflexi bacterium]|nr:CoA-binding protein [Chloroflexota bacterium]